MATLLGPVINIYLIVLSAYYVIISCDDIIEKITQHPEKNEVRSGQDVSITCKWSPRNRFSLQRWFYEDNGPNRRYIEPDSKYSLYKGVGVSSLNISSVDVSDTGEYRCEVANNEGFIYSNYAIITVLNDPVCEPVDDEGKIGDILKCFSIIDDLLTLFRNGDPVLGLIYNDVDISSITAYAALNLDDDNKEFMCKATYGNSIRTCRTTPLRLTIQASIQKIPTGLLKEGDDFKLQCIVMGTPYMYAYTWMLGNRIITRDTSNKRYEIGETDNILTFRNVTNNFNGKEITCEISRPYRNSTRLVYIITLPTVSTPIQSTDTALVLTNTKQYLSTGTPISTTVVVGIVVGFILIVIAVILIVCLVKNRRKSQNQDTISNECVPLKDALCSTQPTTKSDADVSKRAIGTGTLMTDSNVLYYDELSVPPSKGSTGNIAIIYDEPRISNSRESVDSGRPQTKYNTASQDVLYDTPLTSSLDNLDLRSKSEKTLSIEEFNELYAKPNKARSQSNDELNQSKLNDTPVHEHTQKNVEGLTYADIEFAEGDFGPPEPKDYGNNYAHMQFNE